MRFCFPEINNEFLIDNNKVNTIVIENQELFHRLLEDVITQIDGGDGNSVLSMNNKILSMDKYAEVISQFIPFDINQKSIVTKAVSTMCKNSVNSDNYARAVQLLSDIEKFLVSISLEMDGDINFTKLTMESIIKSSGVEFENSYDLLGEKLIDYFELVYSYDKEKLFILVNLRSYICDKECNLFMETVLNHGYHIIMIESHEYDRLEFEKRYIIDKDLCEIS